MAVGKLLFNSQGSVGKVQSPLPVVKSEFNGSHFNVFCRTLSYTIDIRKNGAANQESDQITLSHQTFARVETFVLLVFDINKEKKGEERSLQKKATVMRCFPSRE